MEPAEQATSSPLTANKTSVAATSIKCQHCDRHFATRSVEDGFISIDSRARACASCEPFRGLYETLQTREREHNALLDRGPKHHGRALAHEKLRNARVALENFLIGIEAPKDTTSDAAQAGLEPVELERAENIAEASSPEENHGHPSGAASRVKSLSPAGAEPILKRSLKPDSGAVILERKRIKFKESVEERSEYRGTGEFYRGGTEYIPGRYVVAEGSEYWDTSGSTLTFAKFTGQKKVGSTFVDIVPKIETPGGGNDSLAAKSKRRGGRKPKQDRQQKVKVQIKNLESGESEHAPEVGDKQLNSRELRTQRRSTSSTPRVTTRPRRKVAQYDGQEDEAEGGPHLKPSLIVGQKVSLPSKEGVLASEERPTDVSKPVNKLPESCRQTYHDETECDAVELARTNKVVTNLRSEFSGLSYTAIDPTYNSIVSKAVGFGLLTPVVQTPLEGSPEVHQYEATEAEEASEEDSVYYEALEVFDSGAFEGTLHSAEAHGKVEETPIWTGVLDRSEAAGQASASPVLDANALDVMPIKVAQNVSGVPKLETSDYNHESDQDTPISSIEVAIEEALGKATGKGSSKTRAITRRRSTGSGGCRSSRSRVLSVNTLSTVKSGSRRTTPHPNLALSEDEGSTGQDPEMPVELKLQISSNQRLRKEAIGGLHQSVGGLINDQGERPGTPAQRESKASNQSPQTGHINQDLDTMPAGSGKAGKESEALITETHRHRAEAQVDPDTAHDSAQVETFSERDHSAGRRIECNIERFNKGIHDAIEHSREFGNGNELDVRSDVANSWDARTAASHGGLQRGPLNGTGLENNVLDYVVKRATSSPDTESQNEWSIRQEFSLRPAKKIDYVYEEPDDMFEKENA
ncbi:hypothetical protein EJ07DRAFT_150522 [Lizonia empirigonia]|nr:hypothetical protein EJ07DRAFT_150522 [Lizonia empirigonia]